jgi:hypothetical protein
MSGDWHRSENVVTGGKEELRLRGIAPAPIVLPVGGIKLRRPVAQARAVPAGSDQLNWAVFLGADSALPSFLATFPFSSIIGAFEAPDEPQSTPLQPFTKFTLLPGGDLAALKLDESKRRIVG